jgi:hypothetical protein
MLRNAASRFATVSFSSMPDAVLLLTYETPHFRHCSQKEFAEVSDARIRNRNAAKRSERRFVVEVGGDVKEFAMVT